MKQDLKKWIKNKILRWFNILYDRILGLYTSLLLVDEKFVSLCLNYDVVISKEDENKYMKIYYRATEDDEFSLCDLFELDYVNNYFVHRMCYYRLLGDEEQVISMDEIHIMDLYKLVCVYHDREIKKGTLKEDDGEEIIKVFYRDMPYLEDNEIKYKKDPTYSEVFK